MKKGIDTCITGYGVTCGAEVHLRPDCTIEISGGMIIFQDGQILHLPQQPSRQFRYYIKPEFMDEKVKEFMLDYLNLKKLDEHFMEFLLLTETRVQDDHTDSLKKQHPKDIPEQNLLWDKILVILSFPAAPQDTHWLLVSRSALAESLKIGGHDHSHNQELFSKPLTRKEIDTITIDEHLRKVLLLPPLTIPRFGYKQLAIDLSSKGLKDDNLLNPFRNVSRFADIFFEYKAIIDEYILQFRDALEALHKNFGPLLTHKGKNYLDTYRKILMLKLKMFYNEGEHLYYIQYFYDWLRDMSIAFNELVIKLDGFTGGCPCSEYDSNTEQRGMLLMLGPVLGGRTTYSPLIFRDLSKQADSDRTIREVRCLHWRLLMMIRTFDLPFLHLEKVLNNFSNDSGIEEKFDSTDYWEYVNDMAQDEIDNEYNYLPVKFTPTNGSLARLGKTAIPYYYPLDSNSIYSLQQFWDYETTVLRRIDTHLSYNAHLGDKGKPATETVNDSYTNRIEVILPLAFNLEPFEAFRPEGYIGKHITKKAKDKDQFYLKSFPLWEYLVKYNLCVDVIAIGLMGSGGSQHLNLILGMEHRPIVKQGQTLVLFFVDWGEEQIELQECKKDTLPEVARYTVVADFVLPYRYSCCPLKNVDIYTLDSMPET